MILSFDTSSAHCAACVMDAAGTTVAAQRVLPMSKGQAEALMPLLEDMLSQAGMNWAGLTKIGVGTGPGNFTGIRISVATARGLALGLGIPAIGISSLEAAAFGQTAPCYSVVEARGGTIYWQGFGTENKDVHMGQTGDVPQDAPHIGWDADAHPQYSIAEAIARAATLKTNSERPKPLYIRQPDAAPPQDPAPVILP